MIYVGTSLRVADNSGAKLVSCIRVLGGGSVASIGGVIVVSIKEAVPRGKVSAGDVCRAVIVRSKRYNSRLGGAMICFDDNAVVILNSQKEMIGTRVFGPVGERLKKMGFHKLVSLAAGSV